MQSSTIRIDVKLDEEKIPQQISWEAGEDSQPAKAMMVSFWDGTEKTALRIDLWTRDMMVDEMGDFFYQTLMTMADTYQRATQQPDLAADIKEFAREFYKKSRELIQK